MVVTMEYIIIIFITLSILIILAIVYDFNLRELKKLAISEEEKFNKLTDKYPNNIDVCKYILQKIQNNNVKIEEDKDRKTCLYIAVTNKIIIADIKGSYTRIQTICHECLHSIQSKKILLFNFIFSNLYLLYFIIILLLGIFNKIPNKTILFSIMLILSYSFYFVRSYLENDAMIKAKYLAKDYLEEQQILSKDEIKAIVNSYDKINNLGIKMTNYQLFLETIIKTVIVAIIFIIR